VSNLFVPSSSFFQYLAKVAKLLCLPKCTRSGWNRVIHTQGGGSISALEGHIFNQSYRGEVNAPTPAPLQHLDEMLG
jgi:hypothetical protein